MFGLSVMIILLVILSCPIEDNPTSTSKKYSKDFWGEWGGIETINNANNGFKVSGDSRFYITNNGIIRTNNNVSNFDKVTYTLEKISKHVMKAEFTYYDGSVNSQLTKSMYLFPQRIASANFKGNVVSLEPDTLRPSIVTNRSISSLGGIQIAITNLNDAAQTYTETTDQDGNFVTVDTIPDEPYQISAGGQTIEVTSPYDGGDVGTVTITNGLNFKASVDTSYYQRDLYINTNFTAWLRIKNVGTQTATAATYQITLEDGITLNSGNLTGILGSINPNGIRSISLNLTCTSIEGESGFKKIYIQINDPISNKTWTDSVSIFFYKNYFLLGMISRLGYQSVYNGTVVITPRNESYLCTSGSIIESSIWTGFIRVPRMTGEYIIAVIPSPQEGFYKLLLDKGSIDTGVFIKEEANFLDTGNFLASNTEDTAYFISDDIMTYLYAGATHYYKFRLE